MECSGEIRLGDTAIRVRPGPGNDRMLPVVELLVNGRRVGYESLTFQVKGREVPTISVTYFPTIPDEGTTEQDSGD
jgi:hypothetical protein